MKRSIAILLLTLYVNSYTEFHEALRLPLLIEHYAEHKQLTSDMTFMEFLSMHYKTTQSHDDKDNSLPFRDECRCCTSVVAALPMLRVSLVEIQPASVRHFSIYQESSFASHLSDIFQPPRA